MTESETTASTAPDKESEKDSEYITDKPDKQAGKWNGEGLDPNPSAQKIEQSLTYRSEFFGSKECDEIESWIDYTDLQGSMGMFFGPKTLDSTPCRKKYFFGKGYTYGYGMRGKETLLHEGEVDPIPDWIRNLVIAPLEKAEIIEPGWVDSVVMNDYRAGSSIVGHVDPPSIFSRPIVTVTFFSSAKLVFGASFDPQRRTAPAYSQLLERGCVLLLDGYAANSVTHGIRPEDILGPRRVSLVLRKTISDKATAAPSPSAAFLQNQMQMMRPEMMLPPPAPPMPLMMQMQLPMLMQPLPFLPTAPMAEWPSLLALLLAQMQGPWYSNTVQPACKGQEPWTSYTVQGFTVRITGTSADKKKSARSKGKHSRGQTEEAHKDKVGSTCRLIPTELGLMCNNMLLDVSGVSPHALTWRCLDQLPLAPSAIQTWVR